VQALRDAIAGRSYLVVFHPRYLSHTTAAHEIALKAGRNISAGKVLICGDTSKEGHHAFVLDWDYSEFTTEDLEMLHTLGKTVVEGLEKHLKDVTVQQ
jgi:hypothetical protein